MERQNEFAKTFQSLNEETQHLSSLYERKLAALEELKKSLLHQVFNGEL
jgi:type I restriction enzyme S subunit